MRVSGNSIESMVDHYEQTFRRKIVSAKLNTEA